MLLNGWLKLGGRRQDVETALATSSLIVDQSMKSSTFSPCTHSSQGVSKRVSLERVRSTMEEHGQIDVRMPRMWH